MPDPLTIARQIQRLREFDEHCRAHVRQYGACTLQENVLQDWLRCRAALAVYEAFLRDRLPEDQVIGLPHWWTSRHPA